MTVVFPLHILATIVLLGGLFFGSGRHRCQVACAAIERLALCPC
jgi:hypothetical protein